MNKRKSSCDKRKNRWGFTLIEVIVVIALLGLTTAIAAPAVMAVLDGGEDQADLVQMDFLMNAFQVQQASYHGDHNGRYDMLNPKNTPKSALEHFLEDALTNPDSDVYIEGVKRVKTGKAPTEQDLIFKAAASDTHVWIECEKPYSESSIRLRIPGVESIGYKYSDNELANSTWMVVGDDDRLRTEYVADYLMKDNQKYDCLQGRLEDDSPYRYRTVFWIQTETVAEKTEPEENLVFQQDWLDWDPVSDPDVTIVTLHRGNIPGDVTVEYSIDGKNTFQALTSVGAAIEVPNDSGASGVSSEVVFRFRKDGEKTLYRHYAINVLQYKNLSSSLAGSIPYQTSEEGYVFSQDVKWVGGQVSGNPHVFHYKHLGPDEYVNDGGPDGTESWNTIEYPKMDFVTGAVFNFAGPNQYDLIAFRQNSEHQTEMRYYRMPSGESMTDGQLIAVLEDFRYNEPHVLELDVQNGETYVTLVDGARRLLDSVKVATGAELHPAIGYYMNREMELKSGEKAVAEDGDALPLVSYEDDENDGPSFVLLHAPEFYPYASDGETDAGLEPDPSPDDPVEAAFAQPVFGAFAGSISAPYPVSAKTAGNRIEYQWVAGIANTAAPSPDSVEWKRADPGTAPEIPDGSSGWLWAREYNATATSPQDLWARKPWVNIGSIALSASEDPSDPTKQIVAYEPFDLPWDLQWMTKAGARETMGTSIQISNALGMSQVDVGAYVTWNGMTVSQVVEGAFGYHDYNQGGSGDPSDGSGTDEPIPPDKPEVTVVHKKNGEKLIIESQPGSFIHIVKEFIAGGRTKTEVIEFTTDYVEYDINLSTIKLEISAYWEVDGEIIHSDPEIFIP